VAEKLVERRGWLQFSLRTLLVAVLGVSVPLSWFAVGMDRARRQRGAIQAIESLGGCACYAWEVEFDPCEPRASWLRIVLGNDFFDRVTYVNFGNTEITDAELTCLHGLSRLRTLDLRNTEITDSGLKQIAGLTSVRHLFLDNTPVTDAGLEHLKRLYLEWLTLRGTPGITERGMEEFKESSWCCKIEY